MFNIWIDKFTFHSFHDMKCTFQSHITILMLWCAIIFSRFYFKGCVGTHALSGTWGLIVAGLFIRKNHLMNELSLNKASTGLFFVSKPFIFVACIFTVYYCY